ncbi:MAG: Bcr/CflA family efflux MFS transporter [Gammaproteobacteria bacterium]|nr:Bcr/CflA family efflux MFS transporter [Gammaproteobacteria bacterium]
MKRHFFLLATLVMMCMSGIIASDIYVPALPIIAEHFHVSTSVTQQSMSSYLLMLAIFQLIYGSLARQMGDKVTVLLGGIIFLIFSTACAYASSIEQLVIFRAFQAIGACAAMVIGIGIVGKLYRQEQAAKVFSIIFPLVAISTAISPVIGGYLTKFYGWGGPFLFTTLFSFLLLLMVFFNIDQSTLSKHKEVKQNIHLIAAYKSILSNKRFLAYAIISSCGYISYFLYFTQAPFIFHNTGIQAHVIGYLFSPLAVAYIVGNFIANRLLKKISSDKVMYLGIFIFLASGLLMFIGTLFLQPIGLAIIMTVTMSILTLGNGFFLPTSAAGAVSATDNPVLASGLIGFLQFFFAAVGAAVIGHLTKDAASIFALFILLLSGTSLLSAKLFLKRAK